MTQQLLPQFPARICGDCRFAVALAVKAMTSLAMKSPATTDSAEAMIQANGSAACRAVVKDAGRAVAAVARAEQTAAVPSSAADPAVPAKEQEKAVQASAARTHREAVYSLEMAATMR